MVAGPRAQLPPLSVRLSHQIAERDFGGTEVEVGGSRRAHRGEQGRQAAARHADVLVAPVAALQRRHEVFDVVGERSLAVQRE